MTEKELKELETLRAKSPYSLPDNPSQSGWSTRQIKEKFYSGLEYIYSLFRETRTASEIEIATMKALVDEINAQYVAIMTGQGGIGAEKDSEGNIIVDTYAKKDDLKTGNEPVLSYIDSEGNSKDINLLEVALTTLKNSFDLFKNAIEVNGVAKATEAEKATKDSAGNIIKDFYATAAALKLVSDAILNIKNGTSIVKKAYQDQHGNMIDTTYIPVKSIKNTLTDTSTTAPLSAYQGKVLKDAIDAILALLESNDVNLDTVQEIVTYIKENKGTIDVLLTSKVNVVDIVDNLTSELTDKPLSANQGVQLKEYVDNTVGAINTILEEI